MEEHDHCGVIGNQLFLHYFQNAHRLFFALASLHTIVTFIRWRFHAIKRDQPMSLSAQKSTDAEIIYTKMVLIEGE